MLLQAWVYVLAELLGGALAGLSAWPLYGTGPTYGVWHDVAKQACTHILMAYCTIRHMQIHAHAKSTWWLHTLQKVCGCIRCSAKVHLRGWHILSYAYVFVLCDTNIYVARHRKPGMSCKYDYWAGRLIKASTCLVYAAIYAAGHCCISGCLREGEVQDSLLLNATIPAAVFVVACRAPHTFSCMTAVVLEPTNRLNANCSVRTCQTSASAWCKGRKTPRTRETGAQLLQISAAVTFAVYCVVY